MGREKWQNITKKARRWTLQKRIFIEMATRNSAEYHQSSRDMQIKITVSFITFVPEWPKSKNDTISHAGEDWEHKIT